MIPDILTETLATLRRFDPNGDWYAPDLPTEDDDLMGWAQYFDELAGLTETARLAMIVIQNMTKHS